MNESAAPDDATGSACAQTKDYAGDSADDLALGLVLLVLGAFLVGAAWAGPGSPVLLALGVVGGVAGLVLLVRGTHRLATNLDRVLRARLSISTDEGRSHPWSSEP